MIYLDVKGIIDNEQTKAFFEWFGGAQEVFTVENLRKVLAQFPEEKEITLNIDCDGGSVHEGLKIYDELRMSGKTIYTNITGACHSMAVIILLSAPEENRSANKNIRALIHRVYAPTCDYISAEEALDIAESLIMEEDAILDIYEERTGIVRNILEETMREEKVHDAESLLAMNFISKINSYNTNQFFNLMSKTGKSAFENFRSKLAEYKNRFSLQTVNFDYKGSDGEVLFSTESAEDTLAVGDAVVITSGETSGSFTLDDGRVVTIEDSIVTEIEVVETETLEERVITLESLLDEANNLIEAQETELNSLRGSEHKPVTNRKTQVPATKQKNEGNKRTLEDIKNESREKRTAFSAASKIVKQ